MKKLLIPLIPLAWMYGGAAALRRRAYHRGIFPVFSIPVPVISVGAVSAGGSGKTPVTRWLAEYLVTQGVKVGVVCGAYRGTARGQITRLEPSMRWQPGAARRYGDEAILLVGWLDPTIVTCGKDKLGASQLAADLGAEVIIVDDGFQHQRLHRDLEIVIHDEIDGRLPLPAGDGREFRSACRHADVVWRHGRNGVTWRTPPHMQGPEPNRAYAVESQNIAHALLGSDGQFIGVPAQLANQRVFLMAGIARPEAFVALVQRLGAHIVGRILVRDHQPFNQHHFLSAARARPDLILCTEKDAARMVGEPRAKPLVALSCKLELVHGAPLLARVLTRAVGCERRSFVCKPN